MKVVLASPNFHQPRGNTVTVQRMADSLENLGIQTEIISISDDQPITVLPEADLVHGFHAYRFYRFMQQLENKPSTYIVTITGTDVNHFLFDENTRADVVTCLIEAKAIHVFNIEAKETIQTEIPEVKEKLFTIPQGTSNFPTTTFPVQKDPNSFLFVLPAGIRKIKNVPSAITMLKKLHDKDKSVRLWIVGPILEEAEGNNVKQLVKDNEEWVTYLGQVPHEQMGGIYTQANCMLNTSHSEGQSSAILEAMGFGLSVLVSDNEGNNSIVADQETGFVYKTENQFLDYAEQIMNNKALRQAIGANAKSYVDHKHSADYEAQYLLEIYQKAVKKECENMSKEEIIKLTSLSTKGG
ncbi:glycosyltransferase involved in cell wall biosynthesis [Aquibacillus albus]|uniref:Glycosyltransferase involved in cell wall biosynthesis n=1 Tax=Aquibacillus albus TaxID=1168171 RepID=A0ABS2N6A3_9BACI|nr:glycosyltransferase involved in cell wall biosynthesis [Aquibacillus albus]